MTAFLAIDLVGLRGSRPSLERTRDDRISRDRSRRTAGARARAWSAPAMTAPLAMDLVGLPGLAAELGAPG
ncbi:MAG: hypothetical protein JWO36_3469 [Myxococcales bacterium]|nr:hypothetical protein [Myxococcales bacterium]